MLAGSGVAIIQIDQSLCAVGDEVAQGEGLQHFGLIAVAQNPPRDLVPAWRSTSRSRKIVRRLTSQSAASSPAL